MQLKLLFLFAIIIMCKWMILWPENEHTKKNVIKKSEHKKSNYLECKMTQSL